MAILCQNMLRKACHRSGTGAIGLCAVDVRHGLVVLRTAIQVDASCVGASVDSRGRHAPIAPPAQPDGAGRTRLRRWSGLCHVTVHGTPRTACPRSEVGLPTDTQDLVVRLLHRVAEMGQIAHAHGVDVEPDIHRVAVAVQGNGDRVVTHERRVRVDTLDQFAGKVARLSRAGHVRADEVGPAGLLSAEPFCHTERQRCQQPRQEWIHAGALIGFDPPHTFLDGPQAHERVRLSDGQGHGEQRDAISQIVLVRAAQAHRYQGP